ncbi:porin [Paraburkholderia sabiae]
MTGSAYAQSNVTLYGIIDSGLNYTNNVQTARTATGLAGGHQIAMIEGGSAGLQGSRWGLRGAKTLAADSKRSSSLKAASIATTA